jgi:5-formyltetrahydrofolate cyclo-ligase
LFIVQSFVEKKTRLRRHVAELVAETPIEQRAVWDRAIHDRLVSDAIYRRSRVVHCYLALHDEVATERLARTVILDGKRLVVPVVSAKDQVLLHAEITDYDRELAAGYQGILEPRGGEARLVDPSEADLFIVPGKVFDGRGYRIGRGVGYYDRCLSGVKGRAVICAITYELQVLNEVPFEAHDVPVDYIVTERRVIECKGSGERRIRETKAD